MTRVERVAASSEGHDVDEELDKSNQMIMERLGIGSTAPSPVVAAPDDADRGCSGPPDTSSPVRARRRLALGAHGTDDAPPQDPV